MKSPASAFIEENSSIELKAVETTRSGAEYVTKTEKWTFRDGVMQISINFKNIPHPYCDLTPHIKKLFAWQLKHKSPSTATTSFYTLIYFLRSIKKPELCAATEIKAEQIIDFKLQKRNHIHILAILRSLLVDWSELKLPGFGQEACELIKSLKLKQYPLGEAVQNYDPDKGPFTDLEFDTISSSLTNAYADGLINREDYILCYLFMTLAPRPVQAASTKCIDFEILPDGTYILRLPRAKRENKLLRSEFKIRKIVKQFGEILHDHVKSIKAAFKDMLDDPDLAPLFPQRSRRLLANSDGFEYHCTSAALTSRIKQIFKKLKIPSIRTESYLNVFPYRFRRTFCSRGIEEGVPLAVLAELLDHITLDNLKIYADLSRKARERFNEAIAPSLEPIINAYSGKLLRNESEATRPNEFSRIIDLRVDKSGRPMGSCGSTIRCQFSRPWACYGGCPCFEPWLDGPHEAALSYMIDAQKKLSANADARIAHVNDISILGCLQIIKRCKELKDHIDET